MHRLKFISIFCLLLLASNSVSAQGRGSGTRSFPQKQFYFGIGGSNFLGDLGGLNREGTHYAPVDIEFPTTRPSGHIGFRYRFKQYWATTTSFQYAVLKGDDALTNEPYRRNRNLSFRTHLFELSQRLEFLFFENTNKGYTSRYRIQGLKGIRFKSITSYFFSGITGFAYIPQGPGDGGWTNLRPLKTEGQGLPGGGTSYGPISWGVPMGMGVRLGINPAWYVSFELSYTQTFTDYLDDAGGVYYDNQAILDNYGSTSAYFADPSSGAFPAWTSPGELRGDANHKDGYMFLTFSLVKDLQGNNFRRINLKARRRVVRF